MSDGPWNWHRDHEAVHYNASGSGYDLGVDEKGNPLINYNGHVMTINPDLITDILPEEYQPDTDEDPSPEDVAETWIKAGYGATVKYGPLSALSLDNRPPEASLKPAYSPDGERYGATAGFGASRFETVPAAYVPFSEVPAGE